MDQPDGQPRQRARHAIAPEHRPPPGQAGLALLGLAIGILLISIQLWLLTVTFDLYMLDDDSGVLLAAVASGIIFSGGLAMLHILDRRPRRHG